MSSSDEEEKVPEEVNIACLKAAAAGDLDGLRQSVEARAEIHIRDGDGLTPLMLAAGAGKTDCVEFLLCKGAKPNLQSFTVQRRRPGHLEVCTRLEMQMGVLEKEGAKLTALHFAVSSGSVETVDALLKAPGVNVNSKGDEREGNSMTPLHIAAALGMESIVKSLLAAPDIDVNLTTSRCANTALDLAKSVFRRSCSFDVLGKDYSEDFSEGVGTPYPGIMALIEGAGGKTHADIFDKQRFQEAEGFERYRGAMEASGGPDKFFEEAGGLDGKLAAIKLGADVNRQSGFPPILRASYFTIRTLTRALVEAGADIHTRNANGHTALHFAARESMLDTVEYLLAQRVDVNSESNDGSTPLDLAPQDSDISYVLKLAGGMKNLPDEKTNKSAVEGSKGGYNS